MSISNDQAEIDKQWAILSATVDYMTLLLAGKVKQDSVDHVADYFQSLKRQGANYYKKNNLGRLNILWKKMIAHLFPSGDLNFNAYINERTGFEIDIFNGLRERVNKVVEKGKIGTVKERMDVFALANILRQTGAEPDLRNVLDSLKSRYSARNSDKRNPISPVSHKVISEIQSPDGSECVRIIEFEGKNQASTDISLTSEKGGVSLLSIEGINLKIGIDWKTVTTIEIEIPKVHKVTSLPFTKLEFYGRVFTIQVIKK